MCALLFSPHTQSFVKQFDAVQVCDGSVHSVFISHLDQGRSRDTLHELHLLDVSVQTEEVEDAAAVHLGRMKVAHHGNRAAGLTAVGGRLWHRVGHQVWSLRRRQLIPAVTRGGQQRTVWTYESTHTHNPA